MNNKEIKKRVSDKQFQDFIKPNGVYNRNNVKALRKILNLSDRQVLSPLSLTIGRMIEILEMNEGFDIFLNDEGEYVISISKYEDDSDIPYGYAYSNIVLCDVQWETIMKLLEEN